MRRLFPCLVWQERLAFVAPGFGNTELEVALSNETIVSASEVVVFAEHQDGVQELGADKHGETLL
jgi:hypothetical protein